MKYLKNLKNLNLIQFVPLIFVISLVGNSIWNYTAPEVTQKALTTEVNAQSSEGTETTQEAKTVAANGGELDLSKIADGTYEGSGTGFRGTVKVSVKVKDHKITDITILNNSDDAAYFNRAKSGVIANILKAQSLNVDTVSGATYSSKGIIAAVKNALTGVTDNTKAAGTATASAGKAKTLGTVTESGTYKDGTYTGSGTGFRGTVKVSVTIKNGKISSIKILSNKDDAAYFSRAKSGVIASILKKQSTNVDTVSGATYSSNGIIKAVRNALSKAKVNKSSTSSSEKKQTSNSDLTLKGTYKDGTYRGEGEGWGGTMVVSVTIKNNRITTLKVVSHKDTQSFFNQAKVILNTMIAKQTTDVDTISGATYSCNGLKEAVANALKSAEVKQTASTNTSQDSNNTNDKEDSTEAPKEDTTESTTKTYSTKVWCYCTIDEWDFDDYLMSIEFVVTDGKITSIKSAKDSTSSSNTINDRIYIKSAVSGINKQLSSGKSASDVDIVSGATCSSNSIKEAIKEISGKINE